MRKKFHQLAVNEQFILEGRTFHKINRFMAVNSYGPVKKFRMMNPWKEAFYS